MSGKINILILSAGTRNKVVQYFKKELEGRGQVIATDCSNLAPAIYDADRFHLVPRITAPDYLDRVLSICKEEKIDGVFSLIDPELSLLAKERERFLEIGTTPVISPFELVETCFDKYKMFLKLQEKGMKTPRCYKDREGFLKGLNKGEISFPVFVKPVKGSASLNISKVTGMKELDVLLEIHEDLMIQEYMDGIEYGADVYVDMISGECSAIFLKEKIKMRAGETDKSVSVRDEELFEMIRQFAESWGFRGMIDIDLFRVGGVTYLSEVNPRFGGGYPHAYACGVNMPELLINNLEGKVNKRDACAYKEGVCMMKYNEITVMDFHGRDIIR